MSHPNPSETPDKARFALARLSLLLVSMPWLQAGCLIPEPEKFREPERSAPSVDLNQTVPRITQLLEVRGREIKHFTVPFRSEDAGEQLVGLWYLDFGSPQERFLTNQFPPPSTFDDTSRRFILSWPFDLPCDIENPDRVACCHQLSLWVTHQSSLVADSATPRPDQQALGDLAVIVWWMSVADAGYAPTQLGECPKVASTP